MFESFRQTESLILVSPTKKSSPSAQTLSAAMQERPAPMALRWSFSCQTWSLKVSEEEVAGKQDKLISDSSWGWKMLETAF